jgi:hypothetical protein
MQIATENCEIHTFLLGEKGTFFALGMGPFNVPKIERIESL